MAFVETRFPVSISYGSTGGPGFSTGIVESDSGVEQRVARWSNPRHRFNVGYGIRSYDDLHTVKTFFIARQGSANGFRYKDWFDFTSASNGRDTESDTDQNIGVGDNSNKDFQLRVQYTDGGVTRNRKIQKPVSGTVVIALDGTPQASGWTVNTTTGLVTFTTAPTTDAVVTAGFEFDVPVRFASDEVLTMTADNFGSGSAADIPLVELVDEEPIDGEVFYGGAFIKDPLTGDITITVNNGKVLIFDPDTTATKVILPNKANIPTGGPIFFIRNVHATNTLLLREHDDTAIATIVGTERVTVWMGLTNALAKDWLVVA